MWLLRHEHADVHQDVDVSLRLLQQAVPQPAGHSRAMRICRNDLGDSGIGIGTAPVGAWPQELLVLFESLRDEIARPGMRHAALEPWPHAVVRLPSTLLIGR